MPPVIDGAAPVQLEVIPILRIQSRAVLRIDVIQALAESIIALHRETAAVAFFAGDLETVIRRTEERLRQADRAQRIERLILPAGIHVARGGGGRQNRGVYVHGDGEFVGQPSYIGGLYASRGRKLPLG